MNPQAQFCPNADCPSSGQVGQGQIHIHRQKQKRYCCTTCGKTFSETHGTALYQLKKNHALFTLVITLLGYGCPVPAIVAAFELDERTVHAWYQRAGLHCEKVHHQLIGQARLDLQQVQADEIRVKTQLGIDWMALALMVPNRLWLGGVVSANRDTQLIRTLVRRIHAIAPYRPLLFAVDGLTTYVTAFLKYFRLPAQTGKNRTWRLETWPHIALVQVVKHCGEAFSIERRIVHGSDLLVQALLNTTQGGGMINTAYIERLNATFRQRLACLTRRTRCLARQHHTLHAGMFLVGCLYNLCTLHASLAQQTPAMAAALTSHCWTVQELLTFKCHLPLSPAQSRQNIPAKLQKYVVQDLAA